jgi:LysM repeat protein
MIMYTKYYYRKVVFISALLWCGSTCVYSQTSDTGGNSASDWGLTDTTSRHSLAQNDEGRLNLSDRQSSENSSLLPDYTIKKGDCLWNLAFQFLGNPFQWAQIWQLNSYIKNPDLIYPGDILKVSGHSNDVSLNAATDSEASRTQSSSAETSGLLTSRTGSLLQKVNIQKEKFDESLTSKAADSMLLSVIRSKDQLGGSFFASVPFLWFERNASGVLLPGESVVDPPSDRAMYQLYDKLSLTAKKGELFKVGDSIDIYSHMRMVEYNRARATVLKCVGSAGVIEVKGNKVFVALYKVFDKLLGGEHIMKAHHLKNQEIDTLIAPDVAIQGTLVTRAEETESPCIFQTLILNKGSQDGVRIGDVFAVYHSNESEISTEVAMVGYTSNVQKSSSSMTIIKMSNNKISAGDRAVLIRRTVFKGGGEN